MEKDSIKKDYQENVDTLVTFGEEGHTMRKDDPRTKEVKDKLEKELVEKLEVGIASGELSLWEGIDLSNKRGETESYEIYRERLLVIKNLEKIHKQLGIEECRKQFPMGFAYAINQTMKKKDPSLSIHEEKSQQPQTKLVAHVGGEEIPVEIKNDNK